MKCQICGTENKSTDKFCKHCGSELNIQQETSTIVDEKKPHNQKKIHFDKYIVFIIAGILFLSTIFIIVPFILQHTGYNKWIDLLLSEQYSEAAEYFIEKSGNWSDDDIGSVNTQITFEAIHKESEYKDQKKSYEEVSSDIRTLKLMADYIKNTYNEDISNFISVQDEIEAIKKSRDEYDKAESLYNTHDYVTAIEHYKSVIKEDETFYELALKRIEECRNLSISIPAVEMDVNGSVVPKDDLEVTKIYLYFENEKTMCIAVLKNNSQSNVNLVVNAVAYDGQDNSKDTGNNLIDGRAGREQTFLLEAGQQGIVQYRFERAKLSEIEKIKLIVDQKNPSDSYLPVVKDLSITPNTSNNGLSVQIENTGDLLAQRVQVYYLLYDNDNRFLKCLETSETSIESGKNAELMPKKDATGIIYDHVEYVVLAEHPKYRELQEINETFMQSRRYVDSLGVVFENNIEEIENQRNQ